MSGDVLSQNEVEGLLSAMDTGAAAARATAAAAKPAAPSAGPRTRDKVTTYDFKRPERVGKEQMRALQTIHEGFGRNFGAALSALLRSIVEVQLTSVDQLTYSEFLFSLENPTCFNLLKADPLEGNLILDINPSILYPVIDRLLGGGREGGPVSRRPLTDIELRLVSRITSLFLKEMRHAWENVLELDLAVLRVESNAQLVQIVPPNEVVVVVSFELTIGEVRGMMNLCIPFNAIERIGNKLLTNTWTTYGRKASNPEMVRKISDNIQGSILEIVVHLAQTRITTKDLIGLRVGDIVKTETDVRSPLSATIAGMQKFLVHPGTYKGQKAIRVEKVVELPKLPPEES
jgi:flagellar motor switch protein FliM